MVAPRVGSSGGGRRACQRGRRPRYGQRVSPDLARCDFTDLGKEVSVQQALDLDQSPGTAQGGSPALVYHSDWVTDKPIVQVTIPTDNTQSLPSSITAQLTFNGAAQTAVTYTTTGLSPGDVLTAALQDSSTVTITARYPWSVTVTMNYATPIVRTVTGIDYVVSQDGSPFGSGWTYSDTDQLFSIAADSNGPAGGRPWGQSM
jgi:hypothetical protein